jgi:predicted nucleic acid-binding Zn ribbon protein
MSKIVGMDGQIPQKPQPKASDFTDIKCDQCGGRYFRQVNAFKRISAIMSPTGKEQIAPVPSYRCDDCDHINAEFQVE